MWCDVVFRGETETRLPGVGVVYTGMVTTGTTSKGYSEDQLEPCPAVANVRCILSFVWSFKNSTNFIEFFTTC